MGLFNKMKQGMTDAANAQNMVAAGQAEQAQGAAQGHIGVQGMTANPAAFGGPSTTPLAADDPLLQPVYGVSLEDYARVTKAAANQGITEENALYDFAATQGFDRNGFAAACQEWMNRMKQSMVVGQQFNKMYMSF